MEESDFFTSQITFINFKNFEEGKDFFSRVLELPAVYDIGWAVVYRVSGRAYVGAVDHSRSHQPSAARDGILISLTTSRIEAWHQRVSACLGDQVSPIQEVPGAGLRSFFFPGPEGCQFEIQQFSLPELDGIF